MDFDVDRGRSIDTEVDVVGDGSSLERAVDRNLAGVRQTAAVDVDNERRLLRDARLGGHNPRAGVLAPSVNRRSCRRLEAREHREVAAALLTSAASKSPQMPVRTAKPDEQFLRAALEREVAQPVGRHEHTRLGQVEAGPVVTDSRPCRAAPG